MKNIAAPILFIIVALGLFFTLTDSQYQKVQVGKAELAQYEEAVVRGRELVSVRDALLSEYNSISQDNLARLTKMLPESVDNVRLIIEISNIISRFGASLKNIKLIDAGGLNVPNSEGQSTGQAGDEFIDDSFSGNSPFRTMTMSFGITTSYENMLTVLKELEQSLRVLDVVALSFNTGEIGNNYDFNVTIRTYWLRTE